MSYLSENKSDNMERSETVETVLDKDYVAASPGEVTSPSHVTTTHSHMTMPSTLEEHTTSDQIALVNVSYKF